MDKAVRDKLEEKISEAASARGRAGALSGMLSQGGDPGPFLLGFAAGRLYNSFYYQTRRVLGRDPTEEEFGEFARVLYERRGEFS